MRGYLKPDVLPVQGDESGKELAYRLRDTTALERANEATNGVPVLRPPYTDVQLCALFRVSRFQLNQARQRGNGHNNRPTFKDMVRAEGVEATWQTLLAVLDEKRV